MDRLVSILIPAYNAEPFLVDCIKSALAQTWHKKEIILVDDGSRDRTREIARSFSPQGVQVIARPHEGAAAARNHAFSVCHGDFIQWLDADDLLAPDKIEKQLRALERCYDERRLISGAWARFYYCLHRARFRPTSIWRDIDPVDCIVRGMAEGAFMQTTSWLVSRKLTEAAGPWDSRLLGDDDGEYFCRVLLKSKGVMFVPEAKAYWRISGFNSLSYKGLSPEKIRAHFLAMKLRIEHVRGFEDSPRVRSACLNYLQWNLKHFFPEWPSEVKELEDLAAELGGKLQTPYFSWKYDWVRRVAGWRAAKRAELWLPNFKKALKIQWDKRLFQLERPFNKIGRSEEQTSAPPSDSVVSTRDQM